ncbi:hypothetical protein [Sneathiella sp. P13V-1]|uniref:hypothetical protein n=1 Tax=Sneathiella sp. P13V-1 TaxID=2697366 RepID=UPI001D12343A|nr:hypothetical protein [Sneathiella sp. P13V-1]
MRRYDALRSVDPGRLFFYIHARVFMCDGWIMDKIITVLRYVPVLGWFVKEAIDGPDSTKINFLLNVVMTWVLCIYVFGYPAIILPLLVVAPMMIVILVVITFDPGGNSNA